MAGIVIQWGRRQARRQQEDRGRRSGWKPVEADFPAMKERGAGSGEQGTEGRRGTAGWDLQAPNAKIQAPEKLHPAERDKHQTSRHGCGGIGGRARPGRRGTRPRVPLGGGAFTRRLVFPGAQAFGARARRTTAGAAVLPGNSTAWLRPRWAATGCGEFHQS